MRSFLIIGLIGTLFASTSIALAHNTPWAWTQPKAAGMVTSDATVELPPAEKASLESELQQAVRIYRLLAIAACEVGDSDAVFGELFRQNLHAIRKVRNGWGSSPRPARGRARQPRRTASSTSAAR